MWNHFRWTNNTNIQSFIEPFLSLFFSPETGATVADINLLITFFTLHLTVNATKNLVTNYLPNNLELAKGVYESNYEMIPTSLRSNDHIFPLSFRISFLFKKLRRIENFNPDVIEIFTHLTAEDESEDVWITLLNKMNSIINSTTVVPLNLQSIYNYFDFDLRRLLNIFFKSLINSSEWWILKDTSPD